MFTNAFSFLKFIYNLFLKDLTIGKLLELFMTHQVRILVILILSACKAQIWRILSAHQVNPLKS